MARLTLTRAEDVIFQKLGAEAFLRARTVADRGALADVTWHEDSQRASAAVLGDAPVTVTAAWRPERGRLVGDCACRRSGSCDHPAALLLLTLDRQPVGRDGNPATARTRPAGSVAPRTRRPEVEALEWERTLVTWVGQPSGGPEPGRRSAGLQFEVSAGPPVRVLLRLVVPGPSGWTRSNHLSWSNLRWSNSLLEADWHRLLSEMLSVATSREHYGTAPSTIDLTTVRSRRIWDLLEEAHELGLPMVRSGKAAGPVLLSREPARVVLRARREPGEVVVMPTLMVGSDVIDVPRAAHLLVGSPSHGVIWWPDQEGPVGSEPLRLAPLAPGAGRSLLGALAAPPVRIPAAHEERFLREVYPRLAARVQVVADDTIELPEIGRSRLVLRARAVGGSAADGIVLDWSWATTIGAVDRAEPLWPDGPGSMPGSPLPVEAQHRADLAATVLELVTKRSPDAVEETPSGVRLASTATINGDQVVRFLSEVLPALRELDDVDLRIPDELAELDCHETRESPAIRFASGDADPTDWYDLTVEVSIGVERVSFHELFVALAEEREFLLLPSGTFFSLGQPEFHQLRELIAESRALHEAPPGTLRIGRYQASIWTELSYLGEVTGAAAAWQQSIRELFEDHGQVALPAGLRADLRPYQHEGLSWLATRYDHDLGAVLADDMGLGKTVQTLALVCHARERWDVGPFLVVAPASVVSNWVAEAGRFAPDLDVRAVTRTGTRRGVPLAEAVAGADIVVTSYTLFRLEYDDYELVSWGGLVLDEAQFVKNPYGRGFGCARRLPTPFKLAITGTPMENNLSELWSLCTITAPGLFPRLDRFTEHYRNPIERGRDTERLDLLRRRIRPFLLRRRKSDVAIDLPAKQEQVLELELAPRHRKVYQTYLQRERQKVLGLLGDLEKNRFQIFRSLTLLRQAALDVGLAGYGTPVPSTKLDHLVEQVSDLAAEGHRTLVFSQFTRFLSAARERLERAGVACAYLDGKTTDRAAVIDQFKNSAVPVFLISLKAGGFGLNLTEADYCILLDPWWNPATEAQAVDRVHRIGQTRPVMVYRYVAKDTIEEKVMALKARKAELFRGVLDDGGFADVRLTAADIQALFD